MAHDLWGESPLYTYQEEVLAEDKGVVVRRGLKEVGSRALARRTETACEACRLDESALQLKVRYLSGKPLRKCGGYKRESRVSYPGRSQTVPFGYRGRKVHGMQSEKSAEGIVAIDGTRRYDRNIVAPPGNQAANRENKPRSEALRNSAVKART